MPKYIFVGNPDATGPELLAEYNRLRKAAGLKELKGWSESKEKLRDRITAEFGADVPAKGTDAVAATIVGLKPDRHAQVQPANEADHPAPAGKKARKVSTQAKHGRQRFTDAAVITVVGKRPAKRRTGRDPYAAYVSDMTVGEALAAGIKRRDVNYDVDAGHIAVAEPAK